MSFSKVKSYAKINLALNVTGKLKNLHKIESIVSFVDLHDLIFIKGTSNENHKISFSGKFSKNIKYADMLRRLCESKVNKPIIGFKAGGTAIPVLKKLKEKEPFYATVYKRSPVHIEGEIPFKSIIDKKLGKLNDPSKEMDLLFRHIAWKAVINNPMSGVLDKNKDGIGD